jgi:hypothetical protein
MLVHSLLLSIGLTAMDFKTIFTIWAIAQGGNDLIGDIMIDRCPVKKINALFDIVANAGYDQAHV